jgi:N-acetylmuramoyl-L-alanine amidase
VTIDEATRLADRRAMTDDTALAFAADSALVAEVLASPRHEARAGGPPDMILLHYTGLPTLADALGFLHGPAGNVSCHYVVEESGRILQLVPESRRAWHAGLSHWAGETDINSRSIGIEIVNPGHDFGSPPFPETQVAAVAALCRDIARRHAVAPERVLAHSDVAPTRKKDPGEAFPWDRLAREGVGLWREPPPPADGAFVGPCDCGARVAEVQALLARFGYDCSVTGAYDPKTQAVVTAFQRHFRPARVDGVADRSTIETLHRLLAARPAREAVA